MRKNGPAVKRASPAPAVTGSVVRSGSFRGCFEVPRCDSFVILGLLMVAESM